MSTNTKTKTTPAKKNTKKNTKQPVKKNTVSFWSELKSMQVGAIILILLLIIGCGFIYYLMNVSPKKITIVEDGADIFTSSEEKELKSIADALSKDKDINVLIVTTRDKGPDYGQSREERSRFAEDYYKEHAISSSMRNNSGICYLIDLSTDEPGRRFMWLFTFGTSYYAMDDDEVQSLFVKHKEEFSSENYYDATLAYFEDLKAYDYENLSYILIITLFLPAIVAWIMARLISGGKALDPVPIGNTYLRAKKEIEAKDVMIKQTKTYHPPSSSSGSSGGGGGGFSGGGGGGHSGGGGGFF